MYLAKGAGGRRPRHTQSSAPRVRNRASLSTASSATMANGLAQQVIEQTVVSLARQMEQQVDRELQKLDNLNEDDIDAIRQRRVEEMKKRQEKMKEWAARGHGEYREIFTEQDFFKEMKGEERMICHFFRENWPCKVGGCCASRDAGQGAAGRRGLAYPFRRPAAGLPPFHTAAP